MSRMPTTTRTSTITMGPTQSGRAFAGADGYAVPFVSLSANLTAVAFAFGYMPASVMMEVRYELMDFMSHHRDSVLSRVLQDFAAKQRAQRMIASRMFTHFGSRSRDDITFRDYDAEHFVASKGNKAPMLDADVLALFEEGGRVSSNKPMIIPVGRGLPRSGVYANVPTWRRTGYINDFSKYSFVTRNGVTYVIDDDVKTIRRLKKQGVAVDAKGVVIGILRRGRRQQKKLRFFERANAITAQHAAQMDRAVSQAIEAMSDEADVQARLSPARFGVGARQTAQSGWAAFMRQNPISRNEVERFARKRRKQRSRAYGGRL